MRATTVFVALVTAFSGSGDSAAAIVAISAPTIEKITTTIAAKIAPTPSGKKPPFAVRLLKSMSWPGQRPKTNSVPSTRKVTMVATLIPANQYSNAPNDATENRLVPVISSMRISESSHSGASNQ